MSKACYKKQRTQSEAYDYVSSMLDTVHSNLKAYKCRVGEHWHVGHKNTPLEAKQAVTANPPLLTKGDTE